jgi:predicted nucleic acid-binding Zn ribbon protein
MENKNESRQVITCDCKHSFAVHSEALDKKNKIGYKITVSSQCPRCKSQVQRILIHKGAGIYMTEDESEKKSN